MRLRARIRRQRQRRKERFYDNRRKELLRAMDAMPIDTTRQGHGQWHTRHLASKGKDALGYAR